MLTDEIVSLAVGGAVGRNDWVHVFQISQMLPDGHASTPELLRLIEEPAASERQAMLEDANLTIVVLSTRYAGQNGGSSEGITPLSCSDLVKGYLESFGTLKVFNPNRDNAALQGGNPEKANGVWLRQWRRMLVRALETGGCVLRLDLEEAGLSDMQLAETDMAADKGVPVVTIEFNSRTTSADLRAALAARMGDFSSNPCVGHSQHASAPGGGLDSITCTAELRARVASLESQLEMKNSELETLREHRKIRSPDLAT